MENNLFERLYKDYKRIDIVQNKITKIYSFRDNEKGNFYKDGNNLYPSSNILDEDNKEHFEQYFDFDIEELKKLTEDNIEIIPAKISGKTIEKGTIKVKEKEEVIEETQAEETIEESKVEVNEELEEKRRIILELAEQMDESPRKQNIIENIKKETDLEKMNAFLTKIEAMVKETTEKEEVIEETQAEEVVEEKKEELDKKLEESRRTALFILDNFKEKTPEFDKETRERILECQDLESLRNELINLNNYIAMDAKMRERTEQFKKEATATTTTGAETSQQNDSVETNTEKIVETKTEVTAETIEESTVEKVDSKVETVEVKNDISFDYYGKTEIENIQKDLMNNITDLKYSFIEQQKKTEQKKQKLEEIFNPMPPLDPEWVKTNKKLEEERFRLNRINNLINSDNFKALLDIENTINSITIEHNKESKRYHFTSNVNPYELAQKTSAILSKIKDDVNAQDLGNKTFVNSVNEKIQAINNNMKKLYSKFGYTDLYFDIKTKYDKINYLKNQISHWKELEKIQGKSYEREINEALYEIEGIKNTIKSLINDLPEEEKNRITNIDEIKTIIDAIEEKKEEPTEKIETPENDIEETETEEKYNDRDEIINIIKGIVSTIDLNAPEEELNQKLNQIEKYLIKLNKIDQKAFEDKYNNAKTDEEKQRLITEREKQVESYRGLFKHENKEIENILGERFNPIIDNFKNDIIKNKEKSEEKTDDIPKKGRVKVIAKKALNWMREHKLATIAIGLALTTVVLLALPQTHMMINSALWTVGDKLGWSAATLGKLHSTNLGLSKLVSGGQYIFEGMSGAYTLGGAVGAEALYSAGSANLIGALTGLTGLGAIGTIGASIINKIKNRKKKKEEEKVIPVKGNTEEKIEKVEETKIKGKELEKEKTPTIDNDKEENKSAPLTEEQKEIIKNEVAKLMAEKEKEIAQLTAENQNLREQIEMLKAQGIEPEKLEEERVMNK